MNDIVRTISFKCSNKASLFFNPSLVSFVFVTFTHSCHPVLCALSLMLISGLGSGSCSGSCACYALVCISSLTLYRGPLHALMAMKTRRVHEVKLRFLPISHIRRHVILSPSFNPAHKGVWMRLYMSKIKLFVCIASGLRPTECCTVSSAALEVTIKRMVAVKTRIFPQLTHPTIQHDCHSHQ